MKILLTGYNGFVGEHVREAYPCEILADKKGQIFLHDIDRLNKCIRRIQPDAVLHLAAQSNVPISFKNPKETYDINFYGTLNLLEALQRINFAGKFLLVSSGEVYGIADQLPIVEAMPLKPRNPYAVSKAAAEALCYQWSQTSPMQIIIARSFNHIGVGQNIDFVIPSFVQQIIEIKSGRRKPIVEAGDIDVTRDFTDVRDVVRAYLMLLEHGQSGEVYNICSGKEQSIREALLKLANLANIGISIHQDEKRLRTAEQRRVCGSYEKLYNAVGWQPQIAFEQSLRDILDGEDK